MQSKRIRAIFTITILKGVLVVSTYLFFSLYSSKFCYFYAHHVTPANAFGIHSVGANAVYGEAVYTVAFVADFKFLIANHWCFFHCAPLTSLTRDLLVFRFLLTPLAVVCPAS